MKKTISKAVIRDTCLQKQLELVENFTNRVNEMTADVNNQDQSASQDEEHNAGNVEILSTMQSELEFVQREMAFLKSLNPDYKNTVVEPGAVVVTKQRTFFIAISSEKLTIEEQVITGMSTNAPIYQVMQGLKKGDSFEFNGIAYKIEDVY